jgi:hypothetical protein
LITQTELQNHSTLPHNFNTVKCQPRDPFRIDNDLLDCLNRGRGSKTKPKFLSVEDFEDSVDVLEDHSWERMLRTKSKYCNSIIGRNVTGVSDISYIQPGGLHIIIGIYQNEFVVEVFLPSSALARLG